MSRTQVFVSFDRENDADLHDLLSAQSKRPGSTFEVMPSESGSASQAEWGSSARIGIRAADEVLVICGENTHESMRVSLELKIAQEEEKPYMLLWGRRDKMCMKPDGARKGDSMYSWTREFLESQITATIRDAQPLVVPDDCKRVQPKRTSESSNGDGQSS